MVTAPSHTHVTHMYQVIRGTRCLFATRTEEEETAVGTAVGASRRVVRSFFLGSVTAAAAVAVSHGGATAIRVSPLIYPKSNKESWVKMSACVLDGTVGQLLIYTQTLPLLIGAGFTFMTTVTGSLYFFCLGMYLFAAQYFMWPIQAYINQQRSPYLCPIGSAVYQFPSIEAFYVFAIGTMVIMYIILYKGNHGWVLYGSLAFWFLVPAGVLVFFQMNTWQEVLYSAGLAVALTAIYMVHQYLFIDPCLPFLEAVPPFSTFNYSDDHGWGWNHKRYPEYHLHRRHIHRVCGIHRQRFAMVPESEQQ